jgi:hypothetical protein
MESWEISYLYLLYSLGQNHNLCEGSITVRAPQRQPILKAGVT